MMDTHEVLKFISRQLTEAGQAKESDYRKGYMEALQEVQDWIGEGLWQEGDEEG